MASLSLPEASGPVLSALAAETKPGTSATTIAARKKCLGLIRTIRKGTEFPPHRRRRSLPETWLPRKPDRPRIARRPDLPLHQAPRLDNNPATRRQTADFLSDGGFFRNGRLSQLLRELSEFLATMAAAFDFFSAFANGHGVTPTEFLTMLISDRDQHVTHFRRHTCNKNTYYYQTRTKSSMDLPPKRGPVILESPASHLPNAS